MSRWFRVYDNLVDDPKVQRLSGDMTKALLNLWCLASQNDGRLPAQDDIAFKLRMSPAKVANVLSVLGENGLIDSDEDGLRPHNWNARQFKSDVSNERVKRHRERHRNVTCNVTGTVTETPPDTDTETDTEQKKDAAPDGAQVVPIVSPEKIFFDQAHQSLGSGGRALAGRLLKAKAGNVLAAHSALLTALQKSEPREYLGAIIRGGGNSPEDLRARGEAW